MNDNMKAYLSELRVLGVQDEALTALEQSARERFIPVMGAETKSLMEVLVPATGAKKILEIGTAVGYSASVMAKAAGEGARILTVESLPERYEEAKTHFEAFGLGSRITPVLADALEFLKDFDQSVFAELAPFDLIFLDGPKGHYAEMLPDLLRLLRPEGLLVADNVLFRGLVAEHVPAKHRMITIVKRMRVFLEMIEKDPNLTSTILPVGDGISLSVKKR